VADPPDQPPPQPELQSPPRAYVNFAGAQSSPSELALTLGYREGDAQPVIVAPLVMAWEFVPALIKLLQDQVDIYQGPSRSCPRHNQGRSQGGITMTAQTAPPRQLAHATTAPALMDLLSNETPAPEWTLMTEARRSELVERLIARAADPDGLDWEYVRTHD
jgi:hypothetical protein